MITCHLRYEIDPYKITEFEEYVTGWLPILEEHNGIHNGLFLPSEGASDIAYWLFSFESLAAYENYRTRIRQLPEARRLWKLAEDSRCIRRFERTFLRPVLSPVGISVWDSKTAHTCLTCEYGCGPMEFTISSAASSPSHVWAFGFDDSAGEPCRVPKPVGPGSVYRRVLARAPTGLTRINRQPENDACHAIDRARCQGYARATNRKLSY
jgi:hypothetical protein